jgi:UDP-N-acetylglucosamine--N-acetylmuramyl-(pentapeptide) pyrophosphoryl-undecaprenol N-acetylglucosamine transferase
MQKQKGKRRIVLTGGHAGTTAIATIEVLKKSKTYAWEIYWIGSTKSLEGKDIPTLESKELPKLNVKCYSIIAGRIQRRFTFWTIPSLLRIPFGFLDSLRLLSKIRPDVILSFGGFAAFPVVVVGWLLGMPVIVHEQTAVTGLANKYSSFFARKIALARPESRKYFNNSDKCVVVGNPITSIYTKIGLKEKIGTPPVILFSGGSRASTALNTIIAKILPDLLSKYKVIHQTGYLDFAKFERIYKGLSPKSRERYQFFSAVSPYQMANYFKEADIIVGRAGANTVAQIMAIKRPAILIPIPFSYLDEQTENAKFAEKFGIAKIVKQKDLTPERLLTEIKDTFSNWDKIFNLARKKNSPDVEAASKLVDLVLCESGNGLLLGKV